MNDSVIDIAGEESINRSGSVESAKGEAKGKRRLCPHCSCLERHISSTNAPFTTRNPSDRHHMHNSLTLDLVTVTPMMQWYPANTIRPVMPMSLTNRYVSKRGRMQGWVIPSCRFDLVSVLFPSLHLE